MLRLEDVQTVQEAEEHYCEVIRNCDLNLRRRIQTEPQNLPGDDFKVATAKAAYRKLQSFNRADDRQHKLELA